MVLKFFLQTYGCQMNEYDSSRISDLLVSVGFVATKSEEEADLIILNTCAIREKASEKVFSRIGQLRPLKKSKPNLVLAVGGCVAVENKELIFRRAREVDIIFGPATLQHLPSLYEQVVKRRENLIQLEGDALAKFAVFPPPRVDSPTAFVSIMEGCNNFCSYCIVPFTRGREISRGSSSILKEVDHLVGQGVQEIHLLGQNVNAYQDPETGMSFVQLIDRLAAYSEVGRLRFTTSHPRKFGDDLVDSFKRVKKLVNHLHLPVQSGSNVVLKAMRRGYLVEDYLQIVDKLRKVRPTLSLTTDLIVGFPGESEEDYLATLAFVKEVNFDNSFSFIYSKRPHTKAALLEDPVTLAEKKERLTNLRQLLTAQTRNYSKAMVGKEFKVLVAAYPNRFGQLSGRTENNRVVNFLGDLKYLKQLVSVRITEALPNSLRGELVITY